MSSNTAFKNHLRSSNPQESTTLIVRIILSWFAVGIRIGSKLARKRPRGSLFWDDFLIVVALIIGTIGPITTLWGLTQGGSGPLTALLIKEGHYSNAQKYLVALWISGLLLFATLALIRLSILIFYRSIFGVESKFRKATLALGIFNILWMVGAMLGNILICRPVSHYWDPLGSGSCGNSLRFLLVVTIIDILMDFILLVLPIPQLLKLNVSLRTRAAILAIFCVGIFVVVTNIIRLRYLYQPGGKLINQRRAVLWTSIHVTAAFICACLPLSKPILVKIATASHTISQYALSLLGSGSGSQHSLGSTRRQEKIADSEPEGDFVRMVEFTSENSLRLDGREFENQSRVESDSHPGHAGSSARAPPTKTITVQNTVEVE